MKRLSMVLVMLLPAAASAAADDAKDIRGVVERSVNTVLDVLRDKAVEKGAKREKVMAVVDSFFDFRLMAKLVLGRTDWPKFDKAQQGEFTALFVKQLRDSYFEKMDLLTDEEVEFSSPEPTKDGKFQMLTHIVSKGQRYQMLYKLYKRESSWKAYDVEIDGISIVRSYGKQYDEFLQASSPVALLRKMREKPMGTPKDLADRGKDLKGKTDEVPVSTAPAPGASYAPGAAGSGMEPAADKSPEKVEAVRSR